MTKTRKILLWGAGLLGLFMIYAPAFYVGYGMHSDYVFAPMTFAARDVFFEARQLAAVGRPLLTLLLTWTGWLIHATADLAWWRFGAWVVLLFWTAALLTFLSRRDRVEPFWLGIIGAAIVILPSSQLFVLWVIQAVQGLSTLILALGAYVLLDQKRRCFWPLSAALFLTALFIYQPTAMMVFALTSARLFFSPLSAWPATRRRILRDVLFFGAGMAVYFLWVILFSGARTAEGTYAMGVTASLISKAAVISDTAAASCAGMAHALWGHAGVLLPVAVLMTAGAIAFSGRQPSEPKSQSVPLSWAVQAAGAGVLLFILVNAPMFLARGVNGFTGYRVLIAPAVWMVLLQAAVLRAAARRCGPGGGRRWIQTLAGVTVLFAAVAAAFQVSDTVRNYERERNYLRAAVESAPQDTRRFLVLRIPQDQGLTLTGKTLPYEFSWMISSNVIAEPMVQEALRDSGRPMVPVDVDRGEAVFYDAHTTVIDLNAARLPPQTFPAPRVQVRTSRAPDQTVAVSRQADFLVFEQTIDGRTMPFWTAVPLSGAPPWVELAFDASPRILKGFTFGVFGQHIDRAEPVICRLLVNEGADTWTEVPLMAASPGGGDPYRRIYRLSTPVDLRRCRLLLVPEDGRKFWPVAAIQLNLDLEP